jgi:hypothetical protein
VELDKLVESVVLVVLVQLVLLVQLVDMVGLGLELERVELV